MRSTLILVGALALVLAAPPASALPAPVVGADPVGDVLGGSAALDIRSSARKARRASDGRVWVAFSIRYAADVGGGVLWGHILLDADGDGTVEGKIGYSHWDNGPRPDACSLRMHGGRTVSGHARLVGVRFTCLVRRGQIGTARTAWIVRSEGSSGKVDRAPDHGWIG
jgi:hypothetical protein